MDASKPAQNGYIARMSFGTFAVFVHWTFPFTGVLLTLFLGKFALATFVPVLCAYLCLILIHELGHAFFALRARLKVHAITITGLGGWCLAEKPTSFKHALFFYAGGLIFQLVAFAATVIFLIAFGSPTSGWVSSFCFVFTFFNAVVFLGNAFPSRANDGAKILALVRSR